MSGDAAVAQPTACARHPKVPTNLRCGRCGTPICPRCLVQTPVGARCRDCASPPKAIRGFVRPRHYAAAIGAGLVIAILCGAVLGLVQIPFIGSLLLLLAGYVVGEVVSRVSNRQRTTGLALIAFGVTCVGLQMGLWLPFLLRLATLPGALQLRVLAQLLLTVDSFQLLVLLIAGIVASVRVTR